MVSLELPKDEREKIDQQLAGLARERLRCHGPQGASSPSATSTTNTNKTAAAGSVAVSLSKSPGAIGVPPAAGAPAPTPSDPAFCLRMALVELRNVSKIYRLGEE